VDLFRPGGGIVSKLSVQLFSKITISLRGLEIPEDDMPVV